MSNDQPTRTITNVLEEVEAGDLSAMEAENQIKEIQVIQMMAAIGPKGPKP